MVLYHMNHGGFLPNILTHRLTKNKEKKAILLLSGVARKKFVDAEKFIDNEIFDIILRCDIHEGKDEVLEEEKQYEDKIKEHYDLLFQSNEISLDEIEEIITTADVYHFFGIYLSLSEKCYSILELETNWFTNRRNIDYYYSKHIFADTILRDLHIKHGSIAADSPYATPVLYNDSEFHLDKNVIHFDYVSQFTNLDIKLQNKILNVFNNEKWNLSKNSISTLLIPTSHRCSRRLLKGKSIVTNFESKHIKCQRSLIYHLAHQIILDYYTEDYAPLVIKPHPKISINKKTSEKFYDSAAVLDMNFNTEFLNFIPELTRTQKFENIVAIGTTIKLLDEDDISKKYLTLDSNAYYTFYLHHKFYAMLKIIESNFKNVDVKFLTKDSKMQQINALCQERFPELRQVEILSEKPTKFSPNTIYLSNEGKIAYDELDKLPESSAMFFLNPKEKIKDKKILLEEASKNILRIAINKKRDKGVVLDYLKKENIYMYAKNELIKNQLLNFSFEKVLKYTGVTCKVKVIDFNKI